MAKTALVCLRIRARLTRPFAISWPAVFLRMTFVF